LQIDAFGCSACGSAHLHAQPTIRETDLSTHFITGLARPLESGHDVYRKFPQYREASVTAREFEAGERVEVDYAGDALEWMELKTGEIRKAYVFVAGLGFSQLLFAWAAEDMKSRNWLGAHRRMFTFYGGVPHVRVPDCLKQGVLKCHLYDPDLNPGYAQLASQYSTAVVRRVRIIRRTKRS
jgi:transposase